MRCGAWLVGCADAGSVRRNYITIGDSAAAAEDRNSVTRRVDDVSPVCPRPASRSLAERDTNRSRTMSHTPGGAPSSGHTVRQRVGAVSSDVLLRRFEPVHANLPDRETVAYDRLPHFCRDGFGYTAMMVQAPQRIGYGLAEPWRRTPTTSSQSERDGCHRNSLGVMREPSPGSADVDGALRGLCREEPATVTPCLWPSRDGCSRPLGAWTSLRGGAGRRR